MSGVTGREYVSPGPVSLSTEVLTEADSFEKLRASWCELHDADPAASVFMSWEWQSAWWKHYGPGRDLRLVIARDDAGRVVGIAPLHIERQRVARCTEVRVLRWGGTGGDTSPDDLDPLVDPSRSKDVVKALVRAILDLSPGWDVAILSDLNASNEFWKTLNDMAAARFPRLGHDEPIQIAYVDLPQSWDDYLQSVGGDRRYTIRNTRRKAETQHGIGFRVFESGDDLSMIYDSLVELHRKRWSARGVPHAFSTESYVQFHREAVIGCSRRGWIRFFALVKDEQPIAAFYCYNYRGKVFYFQAGYDPAHEKVRPGLVLMGHALEHSITSGCEIFDYLRGDHEYKNQWGKGLRETRTTKIYNRTFKARIYQFARDSWPALKTRVKARYPWLLSLRRRASSHQQG